MTPTELMVENKRNLEDGIAALVKTFMEETGCYVHEVRVNNTVCWDYGEDARTRVKNLMLVGVEIDVRVA